MKKTFLSLALVLSISSAFGAESKPVTNEFLKVSLVDRIKENLFKKTTKQITNINKKAFEKKSLVVEECYILSCKTVCTTVYGQCDNQCSLDNWYYFECRECGNDCPEEQDGPTNG